MIKRAIFPLLILVMTLGLNARCQTVLDGLYVKEHIPERKPIMYAPLREADVMWQKRVWRIIDIREKINHPLYYPLDPTNGRMSLFDIIRESIKNGELWAFDDNYGDDFKVMMTKEEVLLKLETVRKKQVEDPNNPGSYYEVDDTTRIDSRKIIGYYLKEDWFIDKQRSVLDVRILGICPIIMKVDEATGAEKGPALLFWLYFPNLRQVLAKNDVFNRFNDVERMSFDDLFWKRMFSSYVVKESNVFDRRIDEYAQGQDALFESERIKDEIFMLEHDLWHF